MRIVFLLTQSLESPGGAGRVLPLAKALSQAGHAVRIIALHPDFHALEQKRFVLDGIEVWYVAQMQVRKVGNQKFYFSTPRLLWVLLVAVIQLTRAVLASPADVVQVCKTQPMNILAAWVKRLLHRTPIIVDADDYETLNNRFKYGWQQRIVAWFERRVTRFASEITVTNTFLFNLFRSFGFPEQRLHLVPHGYDRERFSILEQPDAGEQVERIKTSLRLAEEDKLVVFVGSMSLTCHAIDLLLEAMVPVVQAEKRAVLVLVGGGEDFTNLQELACQLGLEAHTRFTGRVERERVPYYYRMAQVSVDPKKVGELEEAILALKVVESLAAGTPCVSARIGDSAMVLGDAGILVAPGDAQALAEGILQVLQDAALREKLSRLAGQQKQPYAWDSLAKEFSEIYHSRV
jgi:glycosyltransferase involved in cell wall biosynthesis